MKTKIHYILFATYLLFGQWFVWVAIWWLGLFGLWRILFVVYPHNSAEYQYVIPNWGWLRRYLSGRPLPFRFAWYGIIPFGVYFIISNDMKSLRKKKNRPAAKNIERRMRRALRLARARRCGFAGQLGLVMEKRHDISMKPPFYDSTQGNIYSLISAIDQVKKKEKHEDSIN